MKKTLAILTLAILSLANHSTAATLYWDGGTVNLAGNGDGISQGTNGTWNTTIQNWDQGAGLAHTAWVAGSDASFGAIGTATNVGYGLVILGAPMTANTLMITSSNYVFTDGGNSANTLTLNAATASNFVTVGPNVVTSTGLTKDGTATMLMTNSSPGLVGTVTVNAGTLQLGSTATTAAPNNFTAATVAANATLSLQSAASITYAQPISGQGGLTIINKNSGTVTTLTGNNTYSGTTVVAQANLTVGAIDDVNPNPLGTGPLQIGGSPNSAVIFTYGFPGGDVVTTRPLIFGHGTPTINNSSSGTLTLAGPVSFAATASTAKQITLGGNIPAVLASSIPDNGAKATGITKKDANTWFLTGSNSFTGPVIFNGGGVGTLMITNDLGLGAATAPINFTTNTSALSVSTGTIASTNFSVTLAPTRTISFNGPNTQGMPTAAFVTTDSNSLEVASFITGGGNIKRKGSSSSLTGAVRISNDANDFSGAVSLDYGTLEITSLANAGTPCALGLGYTNSGVIAIGSGGSAAALRYVGANNSSTTRSLDWKGTTGALILDNTGIGSVAYLAAGNLKSGVGPANLTLTGSNTGSNILGQVVTDEVTVVKNGAGKWILTGANTYTNETTINGGTLEIPWLAPITSPNPLGMSSSGPNNLVLGQDATLRYTGTNVTYGRQFRMDGDATLDASGVGAFELYSTGAVGMGSSTNSRTLTLTGSNTGANRLRAPIEDPTAPGITSLIKSGRGLWQLGAGTTQATNTYTGTTTVSNGTLRIYGLLQSSPVTVVGGTLAGTATLGGPVDVQAGGTLAPGDGNIGTLTVANTVGLSGTNLMRLSKTDAGLSSDAVAGVTTLTYGGTLRVSFLGTNALAAGDSFQLFSASSYVGDFAVTNFPALGTGLGWSWTPANGTLAVVSTSTVNRNPTNLTFSVSAGTVNLSWPGDYKGWFLQTNAVSIADTNSWFNVTGSDSVTNVSFTVDPLTTNVFYRMFIP